MNALITANGDTLSGHLDSDVEQERFVAERRSSHLRQRSRRSSAPPARRRRATSARALLLALTLLPVSLAQAAGQLVPYAGSSLPPLALDDIDGATHSIADYRGDVVLVNFWATWCTPCVREMPSMERLAARLADEPFTLLAVNAGEEPAVLTPFLERLGLDLTVLLDRDGTAVRDWGVFAYPTTLLLDPGGKATWIVRGELDWESPAAIATIHSMLPSATDATGSPGPAPTESPSVSVDVGDSDAAWGTGGLRHLPTIVARGAREPDLAVAGDGTVVASWLEASDATSATLRVARLGTDGWQAPVTVASGTDWFVNWADFPSVSRMGADGLVVTWPVLNGRGFYGYDLNISRSTDGGLTWSAPVVPHRDGTPTQHGFPSSAPLDDGRLLVTWLDGRANARAGDRSGGAELPTDDMTLRSAIIDASGVPGEDRLLDERVCSCCGTTSVALAGGGALIAYRDRSAEEIRDIAVRRFRDEHWEEPMIVHEDGWRIAGCPVNGPALAAEGEHVAIAWFTAANDLPLVQLAFSEDGGQTFGSPRRVDDGRPLGRTDVVLLEDGSALVSWLEAGARGEELRLRQVMPGHERTPSLAIARSRRGRTMGFPRMARAGEEVVIAWTVTGAGDTSAIGSATLSLHSSR